MKGLTPYRKLKDSKIVINSHVLKFPIVLIEDFLKYVDLIAQFLKVNLFCAKNIRHINKEITPAIILS